MRKREREPDPELVDLFERRYTPMLRLAAIVNHDPAGAEDLVNESFVRLVQHWPKVRGYEAPEAWLRRVVIREAVRTRRRRGRQTTIDPDNFDHRAAADTTAASTEHADLVALVRTLAPRERAVVALHYLEDLTVAETAQILDIAEGTVKAHLSHARDSLRVALGTTEPVSETGGKEPS